MILDEKTQTELEAAAFRHLLQHLRERTDVREAVVAGAPQPELQIGRDLVVAGSAGVELAGQRADRVVELRLDVGVDILVEGRSLRLPSIHLGRSGNIS